ncbi:hypothetical protein [Sphingopyxis alaskensis]|jgi:hypothetical protein|uniref:Secreted protein n=1 Tax=Sphingopyxis alaskensis (strain DSM 13593 / LMG 18877 / RB2256) TaxID=317655 RepID=Q1GT83_SPHAL|nr:hypothetical protein [Sphingopyxis alaskensis]ABF53139.1 hypothetical protein Sala_1425 [Sphingopyxis alaskensis RB2256]MCM3420503.1 hypothetical protein [Sphingopyxis alaskensis]
MTGAATAAIIVSMRVLLILSALAAAFAFSAPLAAAPESLLPTDAETEAPHTPARLAPLAIDSAWTPRFAAAADELAAALRSRDEARWAPLLGGQWLAPADRARVRAMLADHDSVFGEALWSLATPHRAIFGWSAPASLSAAERAAIEAGQEAEALVCWSARGEGAWPVTAEEADNRPGRPHACVRIAYSIRGEVPKWRAFVEQGRDAPAETTAQRD